MALTGQGIIPSGAVGTELLAVTRRAYIPKLIVQMYKQTPTLSAMMASAELVSGGISSVTFPVQGTALVNTQATDYSGSFTAPQVQNGILEAAYNLKAVVTPIPFYMMEGLSQVDAAVVPLIEARMNDAGNSMADYLAGNLYTASTSNLDIWSLPDIGSTTNPGRGNLGGIDRSANTWWQGGAKSSSAGAPTRVSVMQDIMGFVKNSGGEMPAFGTCSMGTWTRLAQDFVGNERYVITPDKDFAEQAKGARASFTALSVSGVPIYPDPYIADTGGAGQGSINYFHPGYIGFKVHRDASFAVLGPESLLSQFQLGYILVVITLLELVCTKPSAFLRVTNYTSDTI